MTDLGDQTFDVVLMSSVAHHFSAEQNERLARKVARALRPHGIYGVIEYLRPDSEGTADVIGATGDLFFGLSSGSGNWRERDVQRFLAAGGLTVEPTRWFLAVPGRGIVIGRRP